MKLAEDLAEAAAPQRAWKLAKDVDHAAALQRAFEKDAEETYLAVQAACAEIADDESSMMALSICLFCFVYLHFCFGLLNDEEKEEEGRMTTIKRKKRNGENKEVKTERE